ncbi:MAG: hypothetical protein LBT04_08830 [Prevotellaceae bacterium]|jgi:ATP-binding cassette subfamily B protein|nr:hypothetical protein [Prevotellaceae bacterium]
MSRIKFPHYSQLDAMACGVTCLRIVAKCYGKNYTLDFMQELGNMQHFTIRSCRANYLIINVL